MPVRVHLVGGGRHSDSCDKQRIAQVRADQTFGLKRHRSQGLYREAAGERALLSFLDCRSPTTTTNNRWPAEAEKEGINLMAWPTASLLRKFVRF